MNRIFSAQEIERHMQKISKHVLVDIYRQIHRGEESYYEETNGHGNIFRGWDTFVDSRDALGSVGASSVPQGGSRRIAADNRWFTSSYSSVPRPARPPSLQWNKPLSSDASNIFPSAAQPDGTSAQDLSVPKNTLNSTVPEAAASLSSSQTLNDNVQVDDTNSEVDLKPPVQPPADAASSMKSEPPPQKNDETVPDQGIKRKRQDDDESNTTVGRDTKKRPEDGVGSEGKGTRTIDTDTSEIKDETPKTPVTGKREEKTPKRTDSQKRRSSRRKIN